MFRTSTARSTRGAPTLQPPTIALSTRRLTLLHQWGSDAGRFSETAFRGERFDANHFVYWTSKQLLIVDERTGLPTQGFSWPTNMRNRSAASLVRVSPTHTHFAVRSVDGSVRLGTFAANGTDLTLLEPAAVTAAPPENNDAQQPSLGERIPWDRSQEYPPEVRASLQRFFFSSDGSRLVEGQNIWTVSDRRPLLSRTSNQVLLRVNPSLEQAIIGTMAAHETHEGPGSNCGFVRTIQHVTIEHLEARTLSNDPAQTRATVIVRIPEDAPPEPPMLQATPIAPSPINDVSLGDEVLVLQNHLAVGLHPNYTRTFELPGSTRFDHIAVGNNGVALHASFDAITRTLPAVTWFDAHTGASTVLVGLIVGSANRDGLVVVHDGDWSVWDLRRSTRSRTLPSPEPLRVSSLHQAEVADDGHVVLWNVTANQRPEFLVEDGNRWRRVVSSSTEQVWTWFLSSDGTRVALHGEHEVRVLSLRTGLETLAYRTEGRPVVSTFQNDVLWSSDELGVLRRVSADNGEERVLDLSPRFDYVSALAVHREQSRLVVGTARGRVFVFSAAQSVAPNS